MPYFSIYRGIVADRKDPDKMGRLKLQVPMLWEDDVHDYWALPRGQFSGEGIGMIAIPEVGDSVWVQFEGGDSRYPVWEYGNWSKAGALSEAYGSDGEPSKVLLKTKQGHTFTIDDQAGKIILKQKDGPTIQIDDKHISLVIDGTNAISLGKLNSSNEPAVLGDKNATVLDDLQDALNDLATALQQDLLASASGPYLVFANLAIAVPQLLINLTSIKAKIPQTKSNKVTLD